MYKIIADIPHNGIDKVLQLPDNDLWVAYHQDFSCFCGERYGNKEFIALSEMLHQHNKQIVLGLDKIITEDEVDCVLSSLNEIIAFADYILYSDLLVYNYVKKNNCKVGLIYDPKTYIASSQENTYWRNQGVIPILSNELSMHQIESIQAQSPVAFEVFGYHRIMYSKRKLLKLYQQFQEQLGRLSKINYENHMLYLKEELRDDFYPVYQSEEGTFIFTPYIYNGISILKEKKLSTIDFVKINSEFLSDDQLLKAYDVYQQLRSSNITFETAKMQIMQIADNTSEGFLLRKSVLLKVANDE